MPFQPPWQVLNPRENENAKDYVLRVCNSGASPEMVLVGVAELQSPMSGVDPATFVAQWWINLGQPTYAKILAYVCGVGFATLAARRTRLRAAYLVTAKNSLTAAVRRVPLKPEYN